MSLQHLRRTNETEPVLTNVVPYRCDARRVPLPRLRPVAREPGTARKIVQSDALVEEGMNCEGRTRYGRAAARKGGATKRQRGPRPVGQGAIGASRNSAFAPFDRETEATKLEATKLEEVERPEEEEETKRVEEDEQVMSEVQDMFLHGVAEIATELATALNEESRAREAALAGDKPTSILDKIARLSGRWRRRREEDRVYN